MSGAAHEDEERKQDRKDEDLGGHPGQTRVLPQRKKDLDRNAKVRNGNDEVGDVHGAVQKVLCVQ